MIQTEVLTCFAGSSKITINWIAVHCGANHLYRRNMDFAQAMGRNSFSDMVDKLFLFLPFDRTLLRTVATGLKSWFKLQLFFVGKKKTNNNKSFSFALKCWLLLLRPWRACLQQIAMPLLIFVFVIMFSLLNTCVYVCKGWGKFVAYGSQINCCRLRYLQTKVLWCCAPHTLSLLHPHTLTDTPIKGVIGHTLIHRNIYAHTPIHMLPPTH